MDNAKNQLVDRLKSANSVLITVSRNPSVDQLAACLGLTLIINKLGKHGSAVFSGEVPSTIEFLKPEETLEKTADSLRDFIIALDKNKADKLRYKVEDQMVKIFITPYKTSLSEQDLEFSQGDFNVEVVVALGVKNQQDLDQAIVSHGRILHDATVACINTSEKADLGTINWQDSTASSLCELVTDLAMTIGQNLLDKQIATALLTGIIAETNRFSNEKTTSQTMSVSSQLMAAGANQQLVATNLSDNSANQPVAGEQDNNNDGTLNINHDKEDLDISTLPKPAETGDGQSAPETPTPGLSDQSNAALPRLVTKPPTLGGTLTANSAPEPYDPSTDPLSNEVVPAPLTPSTSNSPNLSPPTWSPPPPTWSPPSPPNSQESTSIDQTKLDTSPHKEPTLNDLEKVVDSPHLKLQNPDEARKQVDNVINESPSNTPEVDKALNALPLGEPLHEENDKPEPTNNTSNLQSLISELPSNDQAPPVPPPIKYPINGDPPKEAK